MTKGGWWLSFEVVRGWEGFAFVSGRGTLQIPPLRFAPVGMTKVRRWLSFEVVRGWESPAFG
jgi:hypothetical protein